MTNSATRILTRSKILLGVVAVFLLTGCEAKLGDFFLPATEVDTGGGGGGGSSFPTAIELDGLSVIVNYSTTSTTCETSLPPFTAPADLTTTGTGTVMLHVQFPDAPVPISGVYVVETGAYDGETGDVDIGGGLFANEQWSTNFTKSGSMISMTGNSVVDVSGSFTCQRQFVIGFSASF